MGDKDEEDAGESADMVPKSRLDAKQRKIDALAVELAEARKEHETLTGEFTAYKATVSEDLTLVRAGIVDAEDAELVRFRWGKLPEKDRPAIADWVKDGAKEDRHLKHLFAQSEQKTAETAKTTETKPATPKPGSTNVGAKPDPAAANGATVKWWAGLSASEKQAKRKELGRETIDRGLAGGWPTG